MNISDEQRKILMQYVPSAEKWISEDNIFELELALDAQITEIGMDKKFELNDIGIKLQKLYDQIYNQN